MKYSNLSLVRDERVDDNRNRLYVSWALSCVLNVVPSSIIGACVWWKTILILFHQRKFIRRTSMRSLPHSLEFHLRRVMVYLLKELHLQKLLKRGQKFLSLHLSLAWMHWYQFSSVTGIMWHMQMRQLFSSRRVTVRLVISVTILLRLWRILLKPLSRETGKVLFILQEQPSRCFRHYIGYLKIWRKIVATFLLQC